MATNQTGVQIVIKAWLPVTGSISEQITKLQMVETAHTTGDYAELLKAATVEDIKAEQKTRRIEDAPAAAATNAANEAGSTDETRFTEAMDALQPAGDPEQMKPIEEVAEKANGDGVSAEVVRPPSEEPAPRRRKAAAE